MQIVKSVLHKDKPSMKYESQKNRIIIKEPEDFDPIKIFECGQCFRWNADENGVYIGVFRGRAASVYTESGNIIISASEGTKISDLIDYFDLERDYAEIRKSVGIDEYMLKATEFGKGIRILRQEPWEALCSFIISQCNNIPRIKKIIETMCRFFGEPFEFEGKTLYTFPSAERISALEPCDLEPLRCGYRAEYIVGAARALTEGSLDISSLEGQNYQEALKSLKGLNGVGDKVANCIILFGLQKLNAFPIDVWMKKALAEHYDKGFSPDVFGEYAGIAQQYMFYYARSGEK